MILLLTIAAEIAVEEAKRQAALDELNILDTPAESEYDDITRLAAEICQTPISLISLIDNSRQWFKSKHGLDASETPREHAFCAHAIKTPREVFVVPDSREDIRFAKNPLVTGAPNVVFYAGVPLVSEHGNAYGTLCIIDNKPKKLTDNQIELLKALANQVVKLFELRKANAKLILSQQELQRKNAELEKFAYTVSHDIKTPVSNLHTIAGIMKEDYSAQLDEEGQRFIDYLINSSAKVKNLVDGILKYYTTDELANLKLEPINVVPFLKQTAEFVNFNDKVTFNYPTNTAEIEVNKVALEQIIINLTNNAIKYNDKETIEISYSFSQDATHYFFTVKDNGMGIEAAKLPNIFGLFTTLNTPDRYGKKGTGIGLSTVKKLVECLGGDITVESTPGTGTEFTFSIKK